MWGEALLRKWKKESGKQLDSERLLVNIDVHLKQNLTTREIEGLMDKIKQDIRKEVPEVKHIQVELETLV